MLYSKIFRAIRAKCLDCSGNSANNVKHCPCTDCSLYPYRFGEEPNLFADLSTSSKSVKSKPVPYPVHSE